MEHSKLIVAAIALFAGACGSGAVSHRDTAKAHALPCAGGTVRSDAELARYNGCTAVVGDLRVRGVTGLAPLGNLQSVSGTLQVGPTQALYDLDGLEELRSVGELVLERNTGLVSVSSLNTLTAAKRVRAERNPRLSASFGFVNSVDRTTCSFELSRNIGLEAEGVAQELESKSRNMVGML